MAFQAGLAGCSQLRINRHPVVPMVNDMATCHGKPQCENSLEGIKNHESRCPWPNLDFPFPLRDSEKHPFSETETRGTLLSNRQEHSLSYCNERTQVRTEHSALARGGRGPALPCPVPRGLGCGLRICPPALWPCESPELC